MKIKFPEISISVKIKGVEFGELYTITDSKSAYEVAKVIFNADTIQWTEEMLVVCLNSANKVIGKYKVSQGGIAGTVCDPKVIFTIALQCCASRIVLFHNHPSGSCKPSENDLKLTKRIRQVGDILQIDVLDHLIIGDNKYYSCADEGTLL